VNLTIARDLYARGAATLLASWAEYARGSPGASLAQLSGVSAAVFPIGPERAVYNNALLDRGLPPRERIAAIEAVEEAYRSAGVDRYAAWVHESDEEMGAELRARGYTLDETTRAMGMSLDEISVAHPEIELEPLDWPDYLGFLSRWGVPRGLLGGADPGAFCVLAARLEGEIVAAAIAFDHEGDCGIFNMGTLEPVRRRGLATALTARHLYDAADRGCSTASLQSTPIAQGVYRSVGFRDLGRFFEYAPGTPR
jgi:ribosomal protein S18 acetylase RimI-like enzyme